MPFDKANPPANNRYGVGFVAEKTTIKTAGWADAAPEKNRVFKIINPSKLNKISGRPIGYKLIPTPSQMMLAHPDSVAFAVSSMLTCRCVRNAQCVPYSAPNSVITISG
jgi:primary-amine oxidase